MGLSDALISSFGNLVHAVVRLVGAASGDRTLIIKSNSVQRAIQVPEVSSTTSNNNACYSRKKQDIDTEDIYKNKDIYLTVPELIQNNGFSFECHKVVTKDKYILNIFRIPHGRQGQQNRERPPVLLAHGLLNSAGAWIMHEPDKGLAYMLADSGYDCWMLNSRGCTYSRTHETLSVEDKEYWDFSFHEMGTHDVSSVIDYILSFTRHTKIHYIGHSLGSTKLMIAIDENERIRDKIKLFICFAPAVYLYKTTAKLLSFNAPFFKQQKACLDYFTCGELMSKTFVEQFKSTFLPNPEYLASKCVTGSMYTMGGHNPDQIHWPMIPVVAGHTPSSSSVRTYIHSLQYFVNSEFQQYDYGSEEENMEVYGQSKPPKYNLSKVNCPTVIFYGENDLLCRPEAVEQLSKELPNVIGCFRVECDKFSHTDFLYAKDIDTLLYNRVIQMLNEY